MQIVFDTRRDTRADAMQLQAMLTAFLAYSPPVSEPIVLPGGKGRDPVATEAAPTPLAPAEQPLSFTPGDLSGSAPSGAGAAASPIAPEAPQGGVPMPPTVAQVPAPPATAPVAPAAPSSPAPSAEGVDSAGLPWDKRIHSSSKAKNADGSWRKLRGLAAGIGERVEAELRARAVNPGNATLGEDAAKLAGIGVDPLTAQPLAHSAVVPSPPGVPVPPPAPAAPDTMTAEGLTEWVTPRMMDGRLTFDNVAAALQANGVESLAALKANPAAVPGVFAALGGE